MENLLELYAPESSQQSLRVTAVLEEQVGVVAVVGILVVHQSEVALGRAVLAEGTFHVVWVAGGHGVDAKLVSTGTCGQKTGKYIKSILSKLEWLRG